MRGWLAHPGGVKDLAFGAGGRLLLSAGADGRVRLWDVQAGGMRKGDWELSGARSVRFTPDGRQLVVGRTEIGVTVIDPARDRWRLVARGNYFGDVALDADGRSIFWCTDGFGTATLRQTAIDTKRGRDLQDFTTFCECFLAVSPDGSTLACGTFLETYLFEAATGQHVGRLADDGVVTAVAFSPDGGRLAVAVEGREQTWDVQLWAPATASRLRRLSAHSGRVWGLAFMPDGRGLLSGGEDGAVKLWDATTGEERSSMDWGTGPLKALAVAPDGLTAAAGGEDGRIVLWDLGDA
jgi:WD40 repeat protein